MSLFKRLSWACGLSLVAWAATALVLGVGALAQLALTGGWLDARWQGLSAYVWPLVLWQLVKET